MSGTTLDDRPLRVGLNLLFMGARAGGVGRYARELPGALLTAEPGTEITVFVAQDAPDDLRSDPWAERVRWVRLPLTAGSRPLGLGQFPALPALALALRLDVLHSPANAGPVITPGVTSVVSLMDMIWHHRGDEWDPDPRAQRAMRRLVGHSVRYASRVFAISHAAADDIAATLGVSPRRIVVTPLGVRPPAVSPTPVAPLRARLELGTARVLLCVAQKRPYKNLARLIRALPALPADVILVATGASTAHEADLRALASTLGVSDRVRLPDWLPEADLEGLYALCEGFVLPSLTEGFGLPVSEAMIRGVPVACSDIPALREVAGDAALMFDPENQAALDGAVGRLLSDGELRADLRARGRSRVAAFTWERTGATSLSGYREARAERRWSPPGAQRGRR